MKAKLIINGIMLSAVFLLSGCASLNSNFDCPMKPGVMCESLDQVNMQVDQGALGSASTASPCKTCHTMKIGQSNVNNNNLKQYTPSVTIPSDTPVRTRETVMRIWMAPYEDKSGNYYQSTVLYTVVKPGYWIGQPVKAVSAAGDNA